jgi:hypothetical protein
MLVNMKINKLPVCPLAFHEVRKLPFSEAELLRGLTAKTVHKGLLGKVTAKEF